MPEETKELEAQRMADDSTNDELDVQTVPISELRKVRQEAARYRRELQAFKAKIDEDEKIASHSKMEREERLTAERDEARTKIAELLDRIDRTEKRSLIIDAASAMGFYSPKDAADMIDLKNIEVDSDGNVLRESVMALVTELSKTKPYLIKGQDLQMAGFGPTNPPPTEGSFPKTKPTTANQIDQLKKQAKELLRTGKVMEATRLFNRAWEMEHGIKPKT